jgi:hypothetical protein
MHAEMCFAHLATGSIAELSHRASQSLAHAEFSGILSVVRGEGGLSGRRGWESVLVGSVSGHS